jgi:hypothetical protein
LGLLVQFWRLFAMKAVIFIKVALIFVSLERITSFGSCTSRISALPPPPVWGSISMSESDPLSITPDDSSLSFRSVPR